MTNVILAHARRIHNVPRTYAIAAVLAAACLGLQAGAAAQSFPSAQQGSAKTFVDLEHAFWVCDYAATTRFMGSAEAGACSASTEELRHRKFDGDFKAMLGWWREHKARAHAAMANSPKDAVAGL